MTGNISRTVRVPFIGGPLAGHILEVDAHSDAERFPFMKPEKVSDRVGQEFDLRKTFTPVIYTKRGFHFHKCKPVFVFALSGMSDADVLNELLSIYTQGPPDDLQAKLNDSIKAQHDGKTD